MHIEHLPFNTARSFSNSKNFLHTADCSSIIHISRLRVCQMHLHHKQDFPMTGQVSKPGSAAVQKHLLDTAASIQR